ncbi:MAG: hypothetical protein ITG01_05805 [Comamonas sp.]|nr:hypothetical protein [Comamonas sp.]
MRRNLSACLALTFFLVGCASPAPDIPRQTSRTTAPGYEPAVLSTAPVSAQASVVEAESSRIVLPIAHVSQTTWAALAVDEQEKIQKTQAVQIHALNRFGLITDVQTVDQSTSGTSGGAVLGGAIASAGYIDRAFSGGNSYSAGAHLALGLLGALIGSSLDKAPTKQYQTRYSVKLGDGEIQYFDEIKSDAFRHSIGVCVQVPELSLAAQNLCGQSVESIKNKYLAE